MTVTLTTPFRTIPALTLEQWVREFANRASPLTLLEIADCYAACQGWAVLLDQAIGETSLRDADAIGDKNLLRVTEADGSTFRTFSAYWKPFAIKYQQLFDPAYKGGAYYPTRVPGIVPGYDLSLAGYKVIYQGGPGCLSSRGATCANGETYDPAQSMLGQSVVDNPHAPSINRSIAASMIRYEKWFGGSPPPPPSEGTSYTVAGLTRSVVLPFPLIVKLIPPTQTNQRPGIWMKADRYIQHETGNTNPAAGALMHQQYMAGGAEGQQLGYHFTVDDLVAYQMIPVNEVTWHGGDGSGPCNFKGVACELCVNHPVGSTKDRAAQENAAILAAEIMNALALERLDPHVACIGTTHRCPARILSQPGSFDGFRSRVNRLRKERA